MMADLKTALIDGVATALKAMVPKAVAEALEGQASEAEGAMTKAVLMLFADYARTNGSEGIDALADSVKRALDSDDPNDILVLATKHDALYMSNLVDALQSAEAEEKAQCSMMCSTIGVVLGDISELIIEAAIGAVTSKLQ
jgi:hypothetical protein